MQKLTITTATPFINNGKIDYKRENIVAVVASTKSQNNFVEELREKNYNVVSVKVENLFLDEKKTLDALRVTIDSQISSVDMQKAVYDHLSKVLAGGCIFKK